MFLRNILQDKLKYANSVLLKGFKNTHGTSVIVYIDHLLNTCRTSFVVSSGFLSNSFPHAVLDDLRAPPICFTPRLIRISDFL